MSYILSAKQLSGSESIYTDYAEFLDARKCIRYIIAPTNLAA